MTMKKLCWLAFGYHQNSFFHTETSIRSGENQITRFKDAEGNPFQDNFPINSKNEPGSRGIQAARGWQENTNLISILLSAHIFWSHWTCLLLQSSQIKQQYYGLADKNWRETSWKRKRKIQWKLTRKPYNSLPENVLFFGGLMFKL